jgi:23S rRNA (guanosine2251-2'-O)-methyltransferase
MNSGNIFVVLDNVRSIHNVGSIFRTADCAGVSKIYICGVTPSPYDRFGRKRPAFHKVALGAEDFVPCEYFKSTELAIKSLKKNDTEVVGVEQADQSIDYRDFKPTKDTAFVFGAEVEGVSIEALKLCDKIIGIPMKGKKESLNVSVTAGVILFNAMPIY